MRILLLSTIDIGGGAEKCALDLHLAYLSQGHDSRLLVGYKRSNIPSVHEIDAYHNTTSFAYLFAVVDRWVARFPRFRGQYRLRTWLRNWALPQRWLDWYSGVEDFNYPYSHTLLTSMDWEPEIVHVHNVHGNFFDLEALKDMSHSVPVVWTLHDAWAITGHCAHFLECERWLLGCGACPDLQRPPSVRHDRTAFNWERKREIYANSKLAIATPSRWLLKQVERSILRPWQQRIIPYGVDLTTYTPVNRDQMRQQLGLPIGAFICLFVATGGAHNVYKDYTTINNVISMLSNISTQHLVLVCIGGKKDQQRASQIRSIGYIEPTLVAKYYQAADVLLHAAQMDNFPYVILEALACGTPVIATAVGGIPEQIIEGVNGFLVPKGDHEAMAQCIINMMNMSEETRQSMSEAAVRSARNHFDLQRQVTNYLEWFQELINDY